ncbi:uncharacterized protein LOC127709610 [Mytilus californianus]|uniref:uncharacterized protein LOC127709610 n=1 Tax=Mytilus californianus TaxID=6549 RepID=UPI0022482FEA|nr:uncharacterized protein LOC127709610 [Mytilus californianus]
MAITTPYNVYYMTFISGCPWMAITTPYNVYYMTFISGCPWMAITTPDNVYYMTFISGCPWMAITTPYNVYYMTFISGCPWMAITTPYNVYYMTFISGCPWMAITTPYNVYYMTFISGCPWMAITTPYNVYYMTFISGCPWMAITTPDNVYYMTFISGCPWMAITTPDNVYYMTFISGCPWMAITTPDNVYCTYDSMCLGVECCLNVKLFMFLYTVKAYARYDPCDYRLSVGLGDDSYSVQFDMGYDGVSDEIITGFDVDLLDLVCLIKYDIQKTDIGLIASVGVGFCDSSDTDNCVAFISLLANAVLPLPICKTDGTITWPQDCKTVVPVDIIFVIDESGSVGEDHFRDSMDALVNAVEKLAIAENFVRVGVSLFAGTGTSRTLLQLNSEYDKEAVKQVMSEAVYQKGSHTEIGDAFQYVCDDMFVHSKGDRSDAQNYLILLTDGKSNSGANPVRVQAAACKDKGIRIATVGIGSNTDEDLLKEVAYSMPNYYLSTDYDKLPETLPNLVIQTMDCSTEWVLNFEYKDYFDLDAIKSKIEKAAKNKLLDAVGKLQEELFKALGLPEGFLQSTGPCVRPDKMKLSQLKKELENRGLSTTGSNGDLISRLQSNDRRCETLGTTLYLPEITNPWLKDHLYYSISNDCLRLDVCVDISFTIGSFDYSKSFNAFLELDFCKFLINYGIESETKSVILISYNWGQIEKLTVTKDFQVLLSVDKDTYKKVFKLDFGLRICFKGDCVIDQMFLEDHEIPIPICNENFTFSGDSILALVQAIGGKMTEDVFDMVLKYLGLDKHFKTGQCNVQEGPKDCPVTINPQKYLPANIRTMLQCEMTENCFGLDCCIDLSFQLPLGDRMVTYHMVRVHSEKNVLSIGNGDPAPVSIEYSIDKMEGSQGFIIDAKIMICFPIDGDLFCAPDGGIHILKQQTLPICSQEFYDWLKDCKTVTPADIIFVLDESGSVGQEQFTLALEAISETTDKLAVGENLIRVGMSMFGGTGTSRTGFDLDTSYDKTVISQNILKISYNKQGYTDIGDALRYACEDMFVSSKGDRGDDVKNYVVLMTDGQSNRGSTQTGVNTCRNNDVTIIAVGIGDGISRTELLSVVQDPNHFINTTYVELHETLPDIVTKYIDCSADISSLISDWLKQADMEVLDGVKEGGKQLILKRLGLYDFFSGPYCDRERKPFTPNVGGWNNECPLGTFGIQDLPDNMACHFKDTCTGIECCIDIPGLGLTLHPFIIIDPCEYTVNYGVNTINETIRLINYEWGKTEKINLAGGVIQLQMVIKKPHGMKKFIMYLSAKACFEERCVPDVKIFDGTEIPQPICDLYADYNFKGKTKLLFYMVISLGKLET